MNYKIRSVDKPDEQSRRIRNHLVNFFRKEGLNFDDSCFALHTTEFYLTKKDKQRKDQFKNE